MAKGLWLGKFDLRKVSWSHSWDLCLWGLGYDRSSVNFRIG